MQELHFDLSKRSKEGRSEELVEATRNKCLATSNKCLTTSNKKLLLI